MEWFVIFLICLFALPLIPAKIAERKGRSFWIFYFFGMALWIVAVPVALFIPRNKKALQWRADLEASRAGLKRCPACMSLIHEQAQLCPHCRSEQSSRAQQEIYKSTQTT